MRILLSREKFCAIMEKLEEQHKIDAAFSEALNLVCDGFPAYGSKSRFEEVAMELLSLVCDDEGEWIGHWLYENDGEGFSWWDADENEHVVATHEDLFDLLKLNAAARSSDHKTSPLTPAQFKDKMKRAAALNDLDARHKRFDELMSRQLSDLGFEEGVAMFLAADKWCA